MQRVLTDAFLRSLPIPRAGRTEIGDARSVGLVLRITASGIKSWSFRFRDRDTRNQTRVTIGKYPDVSLSAARATADGYRRGVQAGENPAQVRREAATGARTFGALAKRYLDEHARRKKRSHAADERNLRLHVLPKWKNRNAKSIKRADAIELLEGIVGTGKHTLANRVQSLISKIFNFGVDVEAVETNPCHRLQKRGTERVGRRVLSDAEILLFWNRIVLEHAPTTGLGLKLALLTGARVSEVAGLNRDELHDMHDPQTAAWIIPGTRTKNKRDHLIPLSAGAHATVLELMQNSTGHYLLPTRSRRREGPLPGTSLTQAMSNFGNRVAGDSDAEKTWRADPPTPHDLRRTVETRLAKLRVPKEIRDRVLNHIPGDVGSKHYNLHDYADEKREALERWSTAIHSIRYPTDAAVIHLASARGGG